MRIAFFSHLDMNLFVFRLPWMAALQAVGHEVHAVVPRGEYFERFAAHGILAVPFEMRRGSLNPLRLAGAVRRLRVLFAGQCYDAVDTFTLQGSIVGALAARGAGVPLVICHVTGLGYLFTDHGLKARLLRVPVRGLARRAFCAARRVTFQNPDDLAELASLIPEGKRAIIKGTGVDTDYFSLAAVAAAQVAALRREAGIGEASVVVTFIGRLLRHKGLAELLAAFTALSARHPEALLLLVGWRDEGNPGVVPTGEWARARAHPAVRFLGRREDVREILALTDVYALPSHREGTPRTVLEAMAMSRAVVTTDVPGCRQTVEDGVTGLLVPREDVVALTAALERLIADPDLRRRLGEAGRRKAEREFSTRIVVDQVLRLHEGPPA
ncbi:MAG TPA: glycosyltransferase family 4 protein [Candidatus Methanoperedens sp.]|nr:glycosyltransferase family 4 protein [Candidatus Methanoperedens sp.]